VGWRGLRPWGLGIAACAVVLARRGAWAGMALVSLVWLGYVLLARVDRCRVEQEPAMPCDEPVSGLLGTCYAHRGLKWRSRSRPRVVRGGRLGLRLCWRRSAVRVSAGGERPVVQPPPASDPRRRLMDGVGLAGLVVAVMSVVSAVTAG
jgi:hypothetical protein